MRTWAMDSGKIVRLKYVGKGIETIGNAVIIHL